MKTVTSLLKKKKEYKAAIENNGCKLVYNRNLGGYQVTKGFTASEVEYPAIEGKNMILNIKQLERLYSYSIEHMIINVPSITVVRTNEMNTYKIVYSMGDNEKTGFATVLEAAKESASWSDDQIAMTEDIDGYADLIVNEETDETICYLANKEAVCEAFDIVPGESFMSGLMNVGTYSDAELAELN